MNLETTSILAGLSIAGTCIAGLMLLRERLARVEAKVERFEKSVSLIPRLDERSQHAAKELDKHREALISSHNWTGEDDQ